MNVLQDRGTIEVEAWFSHLRTSDRDWLVDRRQWRFRNHIFPAGHRRTADAIRLLRQERPDVFVTLFGDYAFASAVLAAKLARIPVVIHAMRTHSRFRSPIREGAKQALFRMADGVHACGPDSRWYAGRYGASSAGIFTIREEVDIPFWARAADARQTRGRPLLDHRPSGCVFLYVGHLSRNKGIDFLIDAYASLQADSVDCSLILAGAGEDESRLRARTKALDGVLFTGFVEGEALRNLYAAADVMVFPTLGDAYGHVVQEAMACGLPVVTTTAAGDIRDRVVEGVTGYLVPPRDADALARPMRLLASDAELRTRLGTNGADRIQDWSTELWASRFEEMVFAVIARRQG